MNKKEIMDEIYTMLDKIDELEHYKTELLKRLPFKVCDRVKLAKTPRITEKTAPGWLRSKHFLKKGALGTVSSIIVCDGVNYYVKFDNETWIDGKIERPVSDKHTYRFGEDFLEASE